MMKREPCSACSERDEAHAVSRKAASDRRLERLATPRAGKREKSNPPRAPQPVASNGHVSHGVTLQRHRWGRVKTAATSGKFCPALVVAG
eukprot:scaffold17805_cov116-Isochrysis_galbana.AAC.4